MFLSSEQAEHAGHVKYPGRPLEPDQIRLIRLLPGAWTDPVHCQLFNVVHRLAQYQALSYVWGSRKVTRTIVVNNRPYSATINLDSALRHLRERYRDGIVLWVDALCINQGNTDERTRQVQLMGHIYEICEKVIVYLGDRLDGMNRVDRRPPTVVAFDHNSRAEELSLEAHEKEGPHQDRELVGVFRLIQELSTKAHFRQVSGLRIEISEARDFEILEGRFDISQQEWEQEWEIQEIYLRMWREQQDRQTKLIESLRKLMHPPFTPWWNRIWVIQEVVAPPLVEIVYGGCFAPWTMFTSAAWSLSEHATSCCAHAYAGLPRDLRKVLEDFRKRVAGIDELRTVQNNFGRRVREPNHDHRSLLELLRKFRDRKASDPRDKVYALLSLVKQEEGSLTPPMIPMIPNYALTETEVFVQATLQSIYASRSLSVFSTELDRKFRNDLPSWVPDWGAPGGYTYTVRAHAVELYDACPTEKAMEDLVHLVDTSRLRVRGFEFEMIHSAGDTMWGDEANLCCDTLETWWIRISDKKQERFGVMDSSFWRLICGDVISRPQTDHTVRRATARDELHFVAWSLESARSPFRDRPEHICEGLWSDLAEAHKSVLLLWPQFKVFAAGNSTRGRKTYFPQWPSPVRRVDRKGQLLEQTTLTKHVMIMRLLHAFDFHEAFPISELLDDAEAFREQGPWKEFYEAVTQKLCNEFGLDEPSELYSTEDDISMVDNSIMAATVSRRLIEGDLEIGLGPSNVKVGDELCFLEGGKTPFVVRRRDNSGDGLGQVEHEMVGDCYVQGLMDNGLVPEPSIWREFLLV